jgi:hypothetical protein
MPEAIVIAQFERRLIEMGCPARRLAEYVHELGEHYEDLKQAALEEGLPEKEAEAQARELLGDPVFLAETAVAILRQSSWWGRHPVLGFCVLPIPAFIIAGAVCLAFMGGLCWLLGFIFGPAYRIDASIGHALSDDAGAFKMFVTPFNTGTHLGAIFLVLLVFCWMARRAAMGLKWMLAACASCAFISVYAVFEIRPRQILLMVSSNPSNLLLAATPLLVAFGIFVGQRLRERRFVGIPRPVENAPQMAPVVRPRKAIYKMPTYWITVILTLAMLQLLAWPVTNEFLKNAQQRQLYNKVWPVERAATMALLKTHQSVPLLPNEKTIDLKPFLNRTLADSIAGAGKDNNLSALAAGVHTFNGVSFDVQGIVKLEGKPFAGGDEKFPTRINIPISDKCSRLYLLHGASHLDTPGARIGWLLLHYQDGSTARIDINGGEHVLDWWGPIYNTDSGVGRYTTSPETELAWAGSNSDIKENAGDFSLRLYKTAFANPHPERAISSIDYVSALSGASPFLAGLTIDSNE